MVGRRSARGDAGTSWGTRLSCPNSAWAHANTDRRMAKQRLIFMRDSGMKKYSWRAGWSWKYEGSRVVSTSLPWMLRRPLERRSCVAGLLGFRLLFDMSRRIFLENGQQGLSSGGRPNLAFPDNFFRGDLAAVDQFVTAVIGAQ